MASYVTQKVLRPIDFKIFVIFSLITEKSTRICTQNNSMCDSGNIIWPLNLKGFDLSCSFRNRMSADDFFWGREKWKCLMYKHDNPINLNNWNSTIKFTISHFIFFPNAQSSQLIFKCCLLSLKLCYDKKKTLTYFLFLQSDFNEILALERQWTIVMYYNSIVCLNVALLIINAITYALAEAETHWLHGWNANALHYIHQINIIFNQTKSCAIFDDAKKIMKRSKIGRNKITKTN